jgi:catechol 2,3-dioxygenase-like lactoylglutathione lyase family enzyme
MTSAGPRTPTVDYKLEMVPLPVADVDRAKEFYDRLGWHCDVDHHPSEQFRVVQFTPPGSACSVSFGIGITDGTPGTVRGLHLVVSDIAAAHAELTGRGLEISGIRHMTADGWQPGPDPDRGRFASMADFADPDGNTWVLQEVPDEAGAA